jgi:altronate hydrolase
MLISLQETPALKLHPDDDVAVALMPLPAGRQIAVAEHSVRLGANIGAGHKIALRAVEQGQPVRRYGQVIGFATRPIAPGDHIHSHNLAVGAMTLEYEFSTDIRPLPAVAPRTFMGYRRPSGRAGTRNTIAVIATVNCSAHTVRRIAARARAELMPKYPNVTDVIAVAHRSGCATKTTGPEIEMLRRTLAGFARHPNVAGFIFVGLGCETNQFEDLLTSQRDRLGITGLPPYIGIQDEGGVASTIEAGVRAVEQLMPMANDSAREPVPLSELCLALQCGGSDGFSGITGNPALGHAVDLLVAHGGTAVLSEPPEVYGAEHLLPMANDSAREPVPPCSRRPPRSTAPSTCSPGAP